MNLNEHEKVENEAQKQEKGTVKKSTVLIIILLLLLLVVGIALVVLLTKKTPEGVVLDPGSGKYEAKIEVPENTDQNFISLPGFSKIYVKAGENATKAELWNPDTNPCYFQYAIVLKETDEVIYESGMIEPGYAVTEIELDRTFEQGIYPIIVRINTYSLEDYEQQMNGGEIDANLIAYIEGTELE